jgi:hypothetical protein
VDRIVKGIIMEISDKNVVLMTGDGEFLTVKKPSHSLSLGDEITAAAAAFSKTTVPAHKKHITKYASIAAIILVLLIPFTYFKQAYATVAYVNVDINPSIELGITKYNKVSEIKALNDDGKLLLDGVKIDGLDLESALDSVIDKARESGYISDDKENNIEVALVAVNDKAVNITQETIAEYVKGAVQETSVDASIKVQSTDKKTHDDASNENMSTNKYLDKTQKQDNSIKVNVKKQDPGKDKNDKGVKDNKNDKQDSNGDKKAAPESNSKNNDNNGNDKKNSDQGNSKDTSASNENNGNKNQENDSKAKNGK